MSLLLKLFTDVLHDNLRGKRFTYRIEPLAPVLSLKKLAEEIRKENGEGANYATLGSIYRRLREGLSCPQ